jgi:ATP-binding cassette subfamily B protein
MHKNHPVDAHRHHADQDPTRAELPLASDENVLSRLEVDLDAQLRFKASPIVLTDQRLLTRSAGETAWQSWPLGPDLQLRQHDHAGVGTLELHNADGRIAIWRFTLDVQVQVLRLLEQFERRQLTLKTGKAPEEDDTTQCPSCKAQLPADSDECPVCTRELQTPPSTWVLLRLWRFAKPYQGQLLAGFLLTLASTAATLVPRPSTPGWWPC